MRFSQLPGITLRHAKDIERASYALMLHADYVRQVVTGIYAYLHLGQCSPQKIKACCAKQPTASAVANPPKGSETLRRGWGRVSRLVLSEDQDSCLFSHYGNTQTAPRTGASHQ